MEGRGWVRVGVEEDDLMSHSMSRKGVCNNPVQLGSITSECVIVIVVGNSVQFIVPH